MGRPEPEISLHPDDAALGILDPDRRRFVIATLGTLAASKPLNVAYAADGRYPDKPVRLIVPVSTGSSGDVRVRLLAEKLSGRLGQRFIVENKPGGGTTLAAALVARAKPDGYTLLATFTPSFTVGPIVYRSAGYDAQKSFTPIASFARASPILAVHPSVAARSVKEFIALAHAKPGTITVGHSGVGAGIHLPSEVFRRAANIEVVYVAYKSEAEAYPDLVGGQISAMFVYTGGGVPLISAGKLRGLAVAAVTRNPGIPYVPTFVEEGYPAVQFYVHGLLLGPAGIPREVAPTIYKELASIMKEPDVVRSFETTGAEPIVGSPEEASGLIRRELETSAAMVKELGITLD